VFWARTSISCNEKRHNYNKYSILELRKISIDVICFSVSKWKKIKQPEFSIFYWSVSTAPFKMLY